MLTRGGIPTSKGKDNIKFEDILEKTLNYIGYNVKRCMNITDVGHLTSDSDSGEDKMLKGAKREHKTVLEIADYYTNEFKRDTEKLNIKWPDIVSKATDNIDMYINIVEKLLKDEYAYISGGNVYFDTNKLDDYYALIIFSLLTIPRCLVRFPSGT